jgi:hypothetical protein
MKGGGGALVFASDWHAATGNWSSTAIEDGGKWDKNFADSGTGPTNRIAVVSATGKGFPSGMANVLAVLHNDVAGCDGSDYWNILAQNQWALPAIGGSIWFRFYFRHDVSGSGGGDAHFVQTGPPGTCPYNKEFFFDRSGTTQVNWFSATYGSDGNCTPTSECHEWAPAALLDRQATYRVEQQWFRRVSAGWKMKIRVYDASNNLVADENSLTCIGNYHGGSHTLATHFAGSSGINGDLTTANDPDGDSCIRNEMIGNAGISQCNGSSDPSHQNIYYGGYGVSLTDWCGPYTPGEAG